MAAIWRLRAFRTRFRRTEFCGRSRTAMPGKRRDNSGVLSMSDFDRNYATARTGYRTDQVAIDAGLRAYMIRVYNYMASGVALTGVVSWLTYQAAGGDSIQIVGKHISGLTPFGQAIFGGPLTLILFVATLGLVFFLSFRINRLQPSTALGLFMLYAGLLGLMLSSVFLTYTGTSITRVFFISAASFGALSLYGYTTQRNLSPIGSFLVMGLFGLLVAMLVQIWLQSAGLNFIISIAGVLIFAGLTAWDTQQIKEMYDVQDDGTAVGRKAVMGALRLYLDFINLFLMMLRLFGDRR
jgi:FtsH-binding integral membrane protein